ncbi:MAG TPA: NAD(P)H-dependent glycerol-3-phosphate dehydrogenase [Longimicrobiales bacterium]|nr:NAD(P)H-dependent glycerol-3-phosphate dehydrogenase [Longimicrobiales bacterium]
MNAVGVVGAGSWGTALALVLARKGHDVSLWSYEEDVAEAVNRQRENTVYLPGVALPPRLVATTDLEEAVAGAPVVVSVSPSQHVARVMSEAAASLSPSALVVSASKGIETATLRTMAEVLDAVLPPAPAHSASFLSGPSFAVEVAREVPTAVTVASADQAAAARVQELFQTSYFRVYTVPDVTGVELGGALKNVIAIASGMAVGLGLGHNTQAALITRGLAEIARLGTALGADPLTFSGLAGMGDLILTCTGGPSRNRGVGIELGKGRALEDILGDMRMVAEGVETTRAAARLAAREGIEMPIVEEVHAVLFEGRSPTEAVRNLMLRDPKPERWT